MAANLCRSGTSAGHAWKGMVLLTNLSFGFSACQGIPRKSDCSAPENLCARRGLTPGDIAAAAHLSGHAICGEIGFCIAQ